MDNYKDLNAYKWFIDGYFYISYRWDELQMAIDNFIEGEGAEDSKKLLGEVMYILELDDWEYIKKINIETVQIYYDEARNKEMMHIIVDALSKRLKGNI